jgi:hypothetical protein
MMGAGNACSSLYKCDANLKTGGGSKKQGVTSRVGLNQWSNREVQVQSNGAGRFKLFCTNQLGGVGVGHSMFGGAHNRADGVQCSVPSRKPVPPTPTVQNMLVLTPALQVLPSLDQPVLQEPSLTLNYGHIEILLDIENIPHYMLSFDNAVDTTNIKVIKFPKEGEEWYVYTRTIDGIEFNTLPFIPPNALIFDNPIDLPIDIAETYNFTFDTLNLTPSTLSMSGNNGCFLGSQFLSVYGNVSCPTAYLNVLTNINTPGNYTLVKLCRKIFIGPNHFYFTNGALSDYSTNIDAPDNCSITC